MSLDGVKDLGAEAIDGAANNSLLSYVPTVFSAAGQAVSSATTATVNGLSYATGAAVDAGTGVCDYVAPTASQLFSGAANNSFLGYFQSAQEQDNTLGYAAAAFAAVTSVFAWTMSFDYRAKKAFSNEFKANPEADKKLATALENIAGNKEVAKMLSSLNVAEYKQFACIVSNYNPIKKERVSFLNANTLFADKNIDVKKAESFFATIKSNVAKAEASAPKKGFFGR
jgi:hypothetical protein